MGIRVGLEGVEVPTGDGSYDDKEDKKTHLFNNVDWRWNSFLKENKKLGF